MIEILRWLGVLLLTAVRERRDLAFENLALRQQLRVLKRRNAVPRLKRKDRLFWVVLSRIWALGGGPCSWSRLRRSWAGNVKGSDSIGAKISRRKREGRPQASSEVRGLIKRMASANPYWGAPRIHGELLKLGLDISERTASRLMPKYRKAPSQTWRAFLNNHVQDLVSIDFFTVPTATFRILFVLVVLAHYRRRVVHFNVTAHPTAGWTGQQMVEGFPENTAPRYLLRDRDRIYGCEFHQRIQGMSIKEVLSAPASPWQPAYVERLIGSIRRDCLDHVIVFGEGHLRRILKSYLAYYHRSGTHLALGQDAPEPRSVQAPELGGVVELPEVGGLHHRYERRAA